MIRGRDRLLRRLGVAIAEHPTAGLQQLGEAVGVSRTTLYRLAPSREQLIELLNQESIVATRAAMEKADIDRARPDEALKSLTRYFMDDAEVYAFWLSDARYSRMQRELGKMGDDWLFYEKAMLDLFERGRGLGLFCADLPSEWLLLSYDAILNAAVMGVLRGTVLRANAAALILTTLEFGVL